MQHGVPSASAGLHHQSQSSNGSKRAVGSVSARLDFPAAHSFISYLAERFSSTYVCLSSVVMSWPELLRIPFGQLRRNRRQITEQTSRAVVWSGGKVNLCSRGSCSIVIGRGDVARTERPNAVDGKWLPAGILQ